MLLLDHIDTWNAIAATGEAMPDLQKVVVLSGNATDPWGDRRKMHVRVNDNLAQEITTKIMSTIY